MKNIGLKVLATVFIGALSTANLSAAAINDLKLSAADVIAAGGTLTVSEIFATSLSTSLNAVDSVIGFDPAVFSLSGFTLGSPFTGWTTSLTTPTSSIDDFIITDAGSSAVAVTAGNQYTVFTFTLTALQNATLGPSVLFLDQNDGNGVSTEVLNGDAIFLNPSPTNSPTVNANDATITVTGAATPEPATFLLLGLPLAGIALLRRRAKQ